jgi:5'-3' exoribonuclease 1
MGIPKFARFLITRYPLILKKIKEEGDVPENDNLYLDINGVIHKCAHNNNVITMCKDRPVEEIFYNIFCYIDQMVHIVKPRHLLMISADGVAPRAKMNQQRSRRFRKTDVNPKETEALRKQGLDPEIMFNSDMISAGTEFMFNLSKAFETFIKEKLSSDPLWKGLKVVLTGVEVPGEGEHKIIEYIRQYKNSENYNPNAKHCIYGLDADLIMLSLITHEPNICILREEVFSSKKSLNTNTRAILQTQQKFEFIYVSILREYLELEFLELKPKLKFDYNIERIIDDFIFFCFFIGNDFLPSLNTLDIDHGALDHIFLYYKESLPTLDDYITYHGKIDFKKAEKIFACLARHELSALQEMLQKVDETCRMREKKKIRALEHHKRLMRIKKILTKKENLLLEIKSKEEAFIINFKKNKVNKKLKKINDEYEKEIEFRGGNKKFKEDLKNFMKNELISGINKLNKRDKDYDDIDNNEDHNSKNIPKADTLDAQKNLTSLFDSDDEDKNKNIKKIPNDNTQKLDKMSSIMNQAAKISRYILDDHYCSDLCIDDIEDEDIGKVSEDEIDGNFLEENENDRQLEENQDMDKVFQKKLLDLYITDVNKAKAFYYKEKLKIDLTTQSGREEHKNMFRKYMEGLQWVLYYYYRGIQSWRWYYPYHYAPMISDFHNIKEYLDYDIDKSFNYGQPYSPFQSLLFILPKTSKTLFPQCYWRVFETFPDFYPNKFDIDFNGKKMPWESVVLLPFLDEKVILDFEEKMRFKFQCSNIHLLADDEKSLVISDQDLERNLHGLSYLFVIENKNIIKKPFEIYSDVVVTSLDSNYSLKNVDYHFPSLKVVNYDYTLEQRKQYFGREKSKFKKFRVLHVKPITNKQMISEERIKYYVWEKVVYVDYPFKQEAIIRGIIFNNKYYYLNKGRLEIDQNGKLFTETIDIINREWYKKGVSLDYGSIYVDVSLFRRLIRNSDGTITKLYQENSFYVPFELTSLNSHLKDFEFLNKDYEIFKNKFTNIHTEFNSNEPVLILSKVFFGQLGYQNKILLKETPNYEKYNDVNYSKYYDTYSNYDLENKDWEVSIDNLYNGPLVEITSKNSHQSSIVTDPLIGRKLIDQTSSYLTMDALAKSLGVSTWTLGLITSSLFVVNCTDEDVISEDAKISDLEHWNLGLSLKFRFKNEKLILPGFTRYIEDTNKPAESFSWEFSDTAVELVRIYKEKYPFVFDCLEKYKTLYHRSDKFFRIYELFSNIEDFFTKLTEIAVWINSLDIGTISFISSKSTFLSFKDCKKIEEYFNNKNKCLNNSVDSSVNLVVNPNYIYQESLPWIPPFMAYQPPYFSLGDRVVNIRSNDVIFVPFGMKGTVTAVSNDFIEVLFDQDFVGGNNLDGRIKSSRGAKVKAINLINMTE